MNYILLKKKLKNAFLCPIDSFGENNSGASKIRYNLCALLK